jgi:hypothetical protein
MDDTKGRLKEYKYMGKDPEVNIQPNKASQKYGLLI